MVSRLLFICSLFLVSCGSLEGQTTKENHVPSDGTPLLLSVEPTAGSPGTSVTLNGSGFSIVPPENIIITGDQSSIASTYAVTADAEEQITFQVPEGVTPGEVSLLVLVNDLPSNSLNFTVTP